MGFERKLLDRETIERILLLYGDYIFEISMA